MKPFDLQVNGYAGADFCSTELTLDQCRRACDELVKDSVDGILATVITDTMEAMCAKLARLVLFREQDPVIRRVLAGFHIEGPFLNPAPGYLGAHASKGVKPATVDDMQRLIDASGHLTRLVTLAPEMDAGLKTTTWLASRGITVSAGHCDPSLDQLRAAIDVGLSMFTHLGNGCPVVLPRHDNIIQRTLSLADRLWICFIPDGHHIPFMALKNYFARSGVERTIVVTDAIGAAKLGPGRYEFSGAPVEVDEHGVARRPGSPNLAGSTLTMPAIRKNLAQHLGCSAADIGRLIDTNPRQAIGLK